jgi:hypothetical protein
MAALAAAITYRAVSIVWRAVARRSRGIAAGASITCHGSARCYKRAGWRVRCATITRAALAATSVLAHNVSRFICGGERRVVAAATTARHGVVGSIAARLSRASWRWRHLRCGAAAAR